MGNDRRGVLVQMTMVALRMILVAACSDDASLGDTVYRDWYAAHCFDLFTLLQSEGLARDQKFCALDIEILLSCCNADSDCRRRERINDTVLVLLQCCSCPLRDFQSIVQSHV